jgi:tetratricopeptide (TPR) repeat protein
MKTVIEGLENLIRSGQFDEVEKQLRKLGKVARQDAVSVANIARRINRPTLAVKILNPIVRPQDTRQDPPTALEKIEYAEALRRLGAVDEAWQLLTEVDADQFPQASIHRVFCLFNQWKYNEALVILQKYLSNQNLAPYVRCVGQINLAAALISVGKLQEAADSLQLLREETRKSDFSLLYGNSLELSAQVLILQKDFDAALAMLNESSEVLKRAGNIASLFVQKWKAIAESLKQNQATQELREFFLNAQEAKHWETIRDCDLYIAHFDQDRSRFERLYFGTPYESFRQRIQSFAGPQFQFPSTYLWSTSERPNSIFDLASGKVEGKKKAQLPTGQALHRFLILICQDFYRPVSVLSAFGKLFPDEFMNANTSANRVHQIVKRCREWIAETGLNLQIEEVDGGYKMVVGGDVGLVVPAESLPLDGKELEWALLKKSVGSSPFDIHQANNVLSSSSSNTQRLLRWALEQGRIEKIGKGSRTSYQIIAQLSEPN